MAENHSADSLTSRVLDCIGLGFLLVPPEVLVLEVFVRDEPVNWPLITSAFAGCYVVGAILLGMGLRWQKVGPALPRTLAESIRGAANSALVWFAMLVIFAFGAPVLTMVFSTRHTGETAAILAHLVAPPPPPQLPKLSSGPIAHPWKSR